MSDARWGDPREYDDRDREDERPRVYDERHRDDNDPRDNVMRDLDLPRGDDRELVVDRNRVYELNGEDSRTLAAVGTFRVVPEQDLDSYHNTIDHLRDEGLVKTIDLGDERRGVVLTKEGRDLRDSHSLDRDDEPSQAFYAGVSRSREVDHDSNLYATYRQEEARLRDDHGNLEIRRVVLEQDLKREYQEFLQERNRDCSDSDGRPNRDEDEIRDWARERDLPYFDGQVHFPDYRIEYEVDGRERHEDVELFTPTTAALTPPAAPRPASASTSSDPAVAAVVPDRIRASWRNSYDARIPARPDVRQRQYQPGDGPRGLRLHATTA
ncbi:MAG: hypothetical protein H0W08_22915 [Acidobacteria bacterium]|nr:hypothetical protein [Acidobacteriota bacterium]